MASARKKRQPPALTDRQREILEYVCDGKTNREIGMILGISGRTVKSHVEAICRNLGLATANRLLAASKYLNPLRFAIRHAQTKAR